MYGGTFFGQVQIGQGPGGAAIITPPVPPAVRNRAMLILRQSLTLGDQTAEQVAVFKSNRVLGIQGEDAEPITIFKSSRRLSLS